MLVKYVITPFISLFWQSESLTPTLQDNIPPLAHPRETQNSRQSKFPDSKPNFDSNFSRKFTKMSQLINEKKWDITAVICTQKSTRCVFVDLIFEACPRAASFHSNASRTVVSPSSEERNA